MPSARQHRVSPEDMTLEYSANHRDIFTFHRNKNAHLNLIAPNIIHDLCSHRAQYDDVAFYAFSTTQLD